MVVVDMTYEKNLWLKLKFTAEKLQEVTADLNDIEDKSSYMEFERTLGEIGYSPEQAEEVVALCYARGFFVREINKWQDISIRLKHILREIKKD